MAMKIGGLQKVSCIDYPGKLASVIFTQGCNFRCQFCHNETLVLPEKFQPTIVEDEVLQFLKTRINKIEAVVISGGEPTIHNDLPNFLEKIKFLKFLIKLDTNGTNPQMLQKLYENKFVDYVAMDIKHEFGKYSGIIDASVDIDAIKNSIELIKNSGIDYEFRSTIIPDFHSAADVEEMAKKINRAKRFILQKFVPDQSLNRGLRSTSYSCEKFLYRLKHFCCPYVEQVIIRS